MLRNQVSVRARRPQLTLSVCADPESPRDPTVVLDALRMVFSTSGSAAAEMWGQPSTDGLGDCHEVAGAIMASLIRAGRAEGWELVTAGTSTVLVGGPAAGTGHSWLEVDGWAIDASNGFTRGGRVLVMDARLYREHQQPTQEVRMDAVGFRRWVATTCRSASM